MSFKPAHKDTVNPPGQIVNSIPETTPRHKTIGGIIDRVMRSESPPNFWHSEEKAPKKKLTFDEWWHLNNDDSFHYEACRRAWKAAQENV